MVLLEWYGQQPIEGAKKSVLIYSVMQSDRNSFCVDVVLDSVNMTFRDEDEVFENKKLILSDFHYEDFNKLNEENSYPKYKATRLT